MKFYYISIIISVLVCVEINVGADAHKKASARVYKAVDSPDSSNLVLMGIIEFKQSGGGYGSPDHSVLVKGSLSGLTPGEHGFHVHELGDLKNKCVAAGGHYNPFKKQHGAPNDAERHVGDLGNISADNDGVANIDITDHLLSLSKEFSIVGRAVVVHEMADDLGRGNNEESKKTGNAGKRAGCGVIGEWEDTENSSKGPSVPLPFALLTLLTTIGMMTLIQQHA